MPLTDEEVTAISEAARAAYPNEAGGFVFIRDQGSTPRRELLFCENYAEHPEKGFLPFAADVEQAARELRLGFQGMFWHSHPNGTGRLSEGDRCTLASRSPFSACRPLVVVVAPVAGELVTSFHFHDRLPEDGQWTAS